MGNEPLVGSQRTYFEPPDTVVMNLSGNVQPEEAIAMGKLHVEWATGLPFCFYLIDGSILDRLDPEVRRLANQSLQQMPVRGIAVHSAPLKARVMIKLVLTALRLFRSEVEETPILFFDTEQEGRDWIAKRRLEVQGAA